MKADVFSDHRHEGSMRLVADRAAVIVVDMVNEFCKPGGKMVLPDCESIVPRQKAVVAAGRRAGLPVVWVADSHRANLRRDREWVKRTPHCVEGTWGTQVIEDHEVLPDDRLVRKARYSAFFQTDLDLLLRDDMITQLIVFGVVTNICVRSTVHDAFFQGYEIIVPHDACAGTGDREHRSSLYDIATHFGTVCTSTDIVASLADGAPIANQIMEA